MVLEPKSRKRRQAIKERAANDILFYVNALVWTFDPRTKNKLLPFVTYPYQDKALVEIDRCIEDGRDLVIEKSRDMGASWMSLVVMEWRWRFKRGNSFLMVSRKEDLVDAPGDPDSLFWKVDFIHKHLPEWMRPAPDRIDRRKLHFGNLENSSTIDGESTTAAAGVGGRRTAMFIDEFSRIEEGYQLLAGTADTTRCRIFNFTPFGTSNAAYKLARRGDLRKLRLHWSEHPEKARGLYRYDEQEHKIVVLDKGHEFGPTFNFVMDGRLRSPWYDGECERRANDREVAEMLDIDYQGSAYQFFDKPMIVNLQATYCIPPYWEGDISYDSDTGRPVGLVPCTGGPLKLWCRLNSDGKPPVGSYGMGGDISTGSGATNSCVAIANATTGEQVGEYASPYLRAEHMAPRATALGWIFKDEHGQPAKLAWEVPGPGALFGKIVLEMGYRNVYYPESSFVVGGGKRAEEPGWRSNVNTKRILLEEFRAALASRQYLTRSYECLEECLDFIHTTQGTVEHAMSEGGDDPTGARVNHGDRVIAGAIAWKMVKTFGMIGRRNKKEETEIRVGSLAWRRQLHDWEREKAEAW